MANIMARPMPITKHREREIIKEQIQRICLI